MLDRRSLLKALGGAGVALPWLRSASAQNAPTDVPLRVLFVLAAGGVRRGTWEPAVEGPAWVDRSTFVTDWALRGAHDELAAYRDRINLFENLDMTSGSIDPSRASNAHIAGSSHMLTATDRHQGSGSLGGGESIDQFIARRWDANGARTRLRSLEVYVTERSGQYARTELRNSYSAPGDQVPYIKYVPNVWERLFPEPLDPNVTRERNRRVAVHDHVQREHAALIARLPAEDRAKVQQMMQLRADIQSRIGVGSAERDVLRPTEASIMDPFNAIEHRDGGPDNRRWQTYGHLMAKLVAAAFHTDTTRMASFGIDTPPSYEFDYIDGQFGASDWHDLDHQVSGDRPRNEDPAAQRTIERMQRRTFAQIRNLLDELNALTEPDGTTVLDNTLVVVASHISEGSHDLTRLPWMTIGDAGGRLHMGRLVRFPVWNWRLDRGDPPSDGHQRKWNYHGRPHNDFFATIARAAGLDDVDRFGRADVPRSEGVISEVLR